MYLTFLAFLFTNANAFTISNPHCDFIARVNGLNLNKKISRTDRNELKELFSEVPVLIFPKQSITPQRQFEVCQMFDEEFNEDIVHHYYNSNILSKPQLTLIGNGLVKKVFGISVNKKLNNIGAKFTKLWRQYINTYPDSLPPKIGSYYVLNNGNNKFGSWFVSMENAYDILDDELKEKYENMYVIYQNGNNLDKKIDFTGVSIPKKNIGNLKYDDNNFRMLPLVGYPEKNSIRKTLFFDPSNFHFFDYINNQNFDQIDNHDECRKLMNNILKLNSHKVLFDNDDLIIFNARKVMLSHTPSKYTENLICMCACFLGTYEQLFDINGDSFE